MDTDKLSSYLGVKNKMSENSKSLIEVALVISIYFFLAGFFEWLSQDCRPTYPGVSISVFCKEVR